MGYPMTYQRVVKRNRLEKGEYGNAGDHTLVWNVDHAGNQEESVFKLHMYPYLVEELRKYERGLMALQGDLRRLEKDTTDENEICKAVSRRTGIDEDTVAAVLKEFISL